MGSTLTPETGGRVVQLFPRAGNLERAQALFARAELSAALSELHDLPGAEAFVLRLRAFIRMGRLREARSLVEGSQRAILSCDDHSLRAAFWTLAASTYHRLNERSKMYAAFSAARGYAFCVHDPDVVGELALAEATVASSEGELEEAERLCAPAFQARSGGVRALAHQLAGTIAAARFDTQTQLRELELAWDALAQETAVDQFLAANVILGAISLAVEFGRHEVSARTYERLRVIEWTTDLAFFRFGILRNLAWDAALRGDHLSAFRLWRESATYAPAPAWKLAALVERTFLAAEMDQPTFAREELSSALAIAETIDWEAAAGDERLELLALAEVASAIEPGEGVRLLSLYRRLATKYPPSGLHADEHPERIALESYHTGVIEMRLSHDGEATALLSRAFDIFERYGFTRRATQCAIHLAAMGANPRYARYAIAGANRFSNSWLARSIAELPVPPG